MANKLPPPENKLPALSEESGAHISATLNSAADLEKAAILEAGIAIGAGKAFTFFSDIGTSGVLASYEKVKKSKAWMHIKDSDGRNFESIDDFCRAHYGKSYNRLQELLSNKKWLGEAFEQAEELGLRQADYNLIKALPVPKQEIIKEALAEGASKEDLQRAIRELAAADQKEIEALNQERDATAKKLAETQANYEAQGKMIADKDKKINALTVAANKKIVADTDWPDALIPLCDQIAAVKREIDHAFSKLETARIAVLQTEMPEDQRPKFEAALKHVAEIYASALASAERHYLKEQVVFAQTLGSFLDMDEM